jgi:uncharacterized protein (TIGR03435 family)
MRNLSLAAAGLLTFVLAAGLGAQQPANPTFDAASVKINKSGDGGTRLGGPPGSFNATNATLRSIIGIAYASPQPLAPNQMEGGPSWLDSTRFDIVARYDASLVPPPGAATAGGPGAQAGSALPPQFVMLRQLLADRFKLKAHFDTRERPLYALMLARADGRLGPKLTKSTVDCAAMMAAARAGGGPPAPPPLPADGRPVCGLRMGPGVFSGGNVSMSGLANALAKFAGRPVVDKTGLPGTYDLQIDYTPDQIPNVNGNPAPVNPDAPSLFTALQEQLGLKLEAERGGVQVLVIDSVEMPTED